MKYFFLLLFLLIFMLPDIEMGAEEQYTFKVTIGNKIEFETLSFKNSTTGMSLRTPTSLNKFDSSFNQLEWEVTQNLSGNHFKAERYGTKILLKGTFRKQEVSREYRLDFRPWYQYPEFCFKEFVVSGKPRMEFWIISPDDLSLFEFEAVKMGLETLSIHDQNVKTVRIRIKALGFAGNFWHADYWFKVRDGKYIRYEAVHGGPGTPPTIKELVNPEQ